MLRTLLVLSTLIVFLTIPALAQQVQVSGAIVSIDSPAHTLVMKMDAGPQLVVRLAKNAESLRPGQRIAVSGRISRDQKAVEATEITAASSCAGPIHSALANLERKACAATMPSVAE